MTPDFSQNIDQQNDSLLDIAFKEVSNLLDPINVLSLYGHELSEIRGQKRRGKEILRQTRRTLEMLQHLLDELQEKTEELHTKIGQKRQRIDYIS